MITTLLGDGWFGALSVRGPGPMQVACPRMRECRVRGASGVGGVEVWIGCVGPPGYIGISPRMSHDVGRMGQEASDKEWVEASNEARSRPGLIMGEERVWRIWKGRGDDRENAQLQCAFDHPQAHHSTI